MPRSGELSRGLLAWDSLLYIRFFVFCLAFEHFAALNVALRAYTPLVSLVGVI